MFPPRRSIVPSFALESPLSPSSSTSSSTMFMCASNDDTLPLTLSPFFSLIITLCPMTLFKRSKGLSVCIQITRIKSSKYLFLLLGLLLALLHREPDRPRAERYLLAHEDVLRHSPHEVRLPERGRVDEVLHGLLESRPGEYRLLAPDQAVPPYALYHSAGGHRVGDQQHVPRAHRDALPL